MSINISTQNAEYIVTNMKNYINSERLNKQVAKRIITIISPPQDNKYHEDNYLFSHVYFEILNDFMSKFQECVSDNSIKFISDINVLVINTFTFLQNIYLCSVIQKDSNLKSFTYNLSRQLILLLKIDEDRTAFCTTITDRLKNYYNNLTIQLSNLGYTISSVYSNCDKISGDTVLTNENIDMLNNLYTLYNGYIFNSYLAGIPMPISIVKAIQSIFLMVSSFPCETSSTTIIQIIKKLLGKKAVNIDLYQDLLKNMIEYICMTERIFLSPEDEDDKLLHDELYDTIIKSTTDEYKYDPVFQPIENLFSKNQYVDEDEYKNTLEESIHLKILRRIKRADKYIKKRIPYDELVESGINPWLITPLLVTTNTQTYKQLKYIYQYYSPLCRRSRPTKVLKLLWERDFKNLIYDPLKRRDQVYLAKFFNYKMVFALSIVATVENADEIHELFTRKEYTKKYMERIYFSS